MTVERNPEEDAWVEEVILEGEAASAVAKAEHILLAGGPDAEAQAWALVGVGKALLAILARPDAAAPETGSAAVDTSIGHQDGGAT